MSFLRPFASTVLVACATFGTPCGASTAQQARAAESSSTSTAAPPSESSADSYRGFDLALLAETLARLTTLRTQHGEGPGAVELDRWLASKGLDRSDYDVAYRSWWERFRADPTGQLEARFHRINGEWVQQLNYADAPDRRQETREGVTLDTYAQIAVALTRLPGAQVDQVIKRFGIKDQAQWQRVNEAWGKAMKEDPSTTLVQQYAALYQKYAGPAFAAEQEAITAASLAEHNRRSTAAAGPPPKPPELSETIVEMNNSSGRERWDAARRYAIACDLWAGPSRRNPSHPSAPHCDQATLRSSLVPVILEAVDRADDDTIDFNVGLLDLLDELGLVDNSARLTAQRAYNRATERLATLEEAFVPIRDQAVPERLLLRTKLDTYTAVVGELERILAKW